MPETVHVWVADCPPCILDLYILKYTNAKQLGCAINKCIGIV